MENSVEEQIQKVCQVPAEQRSRDNPNMKEYLKYAPLGIVLGYTIYEENNFSVVDNSPIYHYTSQNGLQEILEHNSLWFTDSSYLNDVSEGRHIYSVLHEVLEDYRGGGTNYRLYKNHVHDTILDISSQFFFNYKNFNDFGFDKFTTPHYFICSFCQDDDILSMWNYYTKSDNNIGVNIEFETSDLVKHIVEYLKKNCIRYNNVRALRVLYEKKAQKKLIKDCVDITYYYWQNTTYKESAMQALAEQLVIIKSAFKHPAFENEREIRIVIEMSQQDFNKNMSDGKLLLRQAKSGFIPYINVNFDKEDVKKINASPNMEAFQTIRFLLKKFGYYDDIKVTRSTIPWRS